MTNCTGHVFVSYRRKDTKHVAGRLADRLEQRLGAERVFMDVAMLEPGIDFAEAIDDALASCHVLIALIGPDWLNQVDDHGNRRLDDPDDLVVLEIGTALDRGIRVIPVLVDGARMPTRADLPRRLHSLARRHAVTLNHESFRAEADLLSTTVERLLDSAPSRPQPLSPRVAPIPTAAQPEPTRLMKHSPRGTTPFPAMPAADDPPRPADAATPDLPGVTADEVRDIPFSKPPIGKRGYNEDEVDAFLDLIEATLRTGAGSLSAADVHNVAFSKPPIGKRGYNEDEVDVFLDRVEAEFQRRGR